VLEKHWYFYKEKIQTKRKGGNSGQSIFIAFERKNDGIRELRKKESRSCANLQLA
jgi:hypothetical protein